MRGADFQGDCKTSDSRSCNPFTITDGYSRFLLPCQALSATRVQEATPVFARGFKKFGLPQRIRTDHGVPLAANTLGQLSTWWVRLGIPPEFIGLGKPHQNGRHERRHRTLKADTTRLPGANLGAQPQPCTPCREAFHHARPHEALDLRPPASCDAPRCTLPAGHAYETTTACVP